MKTYSTITPKNRQVRNVTFPLDVEKQIAELQDSLQIRLGVKMSLSKTLSYALKRYLNRSSH